jgi:hypothetical protein
MSMATYGTGEVPEMAIFREVTGGLVSEKKPPIQYQPRAPLVLPPSGEVAALPAPVQSAAVTDANWPIDPDQTERPSRHGDPNSDDAKEEITQADAARLKPLAGLGNTEWQSPYGPEHDRPHVFAEQQKQGKEFQAALADAKGYDRTERRYLTDPPLAYREPAATAPAEFEDIKEKQGFFLTRWLTGG